MSETKILDGKGTGYSAHVDTAGRIHTFSVVETEAEYINSVNDDTYIQYLDITPAGANNIFGYFKNTHQTKNLVMNWYRIWTASAAEAIDIYVGKTGSPAATTPLTPVNMKITSNQTATGNFYESTSITGLSGGTLLDRLRLSGDGKDVVSDFPGKIIVPTGGVVTFQALNGSIPIELTVSFHYHTES